MTYNKITVAFGAQKKITGPAISYQYDVVQKLMIKGLDLPAVYRVDFCNEGDAQTISMTGDADGVPIPDQLLQTGKKIKAYIILTGTDEGAVETRYEAILPVNSRPAPSDIEPTPAEQQQIDALIEALNDGVERAEDAAEQAEEAAELLTNPSAEATTLEPGSPATAEYDEGVFKFGIPKGPKGDKLTYADLTDADKADLVQGPILEAQTAAVQAVNTAGDTQTNRVNQAGTTNVNAVNQAATTNLNAVNQAGTTQVGNVNDAGTAQVAAVEAEGTEQVGAVRAKGAEVLESIPDDYTALQHHVDAVTIYETASGAIASFEDGADDLPMKSLVANIEPVQDLHGYDHPWPAGGGANLLDLDKASYNTFAYGLTVARDGDGVRITGTATQSGDLSFNLIVNYSDETLSGKGYVLQVFDITSGYTIGGVWGFRTESERAFAIALVGITEGQVVNCFMKLSVAATTQTAWSPYSNICPISGHTGAEIEQTGKNILPYTEQGAYKTADGLPILSNSYVRSPKIIAKPGVTYWVRSSVASVSCLFWDVNGNFISGTDISTVANRHWTAPSNAHYVAFNFYSNAGNITPETVGNIMVNVGSGFADYEPYTGNTISVTFPSSAGTVYGGTLDVVSGKLVVDRAIHTFDGTETFTGDGSAGAIVPRWRDTNVAGPIYSGFGLSNLLKRANSYIAIRNTALSMTVGSGFYILINPHGTVYQSHTDAINAAKQWCTEMYNAGTPLQVCYGLATPIVYQLTPQEIRTLLGTNNIWASTGDTEVTYPADTKLYIDGKIAEAIAALGT